jgi:hypothetical protein
VKGVSPAEMGTGDTDHMERTAPPAAAIPTVDRCTGRSNGSGRHWFLRPALLVMLVGALLASCSSSGHPSTTAPHQTPQRDTSTTSAAPTTTLPTPATSGPLTVAASVAVPLPANVQITAAEAPDGAVFVSQESHDSSVTTVVWVVDPSGPAEIAEHVTGGVSALAADATNLYIFADNSVTGYTRSTGNQMGQWTLPPVSTANTSDADLVSMVAANGEVLVMIAQGNLQDIYRIRPTSTSAPKLIAHGTSAAFGSNGTVFYERSDNRLVALSPTGTTTVGPLLPNAPNGEGGGIADVDAVAGGLVWVSIPAGQGLDAQLTPYSATTLQAMGKYPGSVTEQIVDTSAGPLVLVGPDGPGGCPQGTSATSTSCVFRISPTAALTDPTTVGSAEQLLGPQPAVVTASPTSSDLVVDRLS